MCIDASNLVGSPCQIWPGNIYLADGGIFHWDIHFCCRWKCKNGEKCISRLQICNGKSDCQDFSDESTEMCSEWSCLPGMRKCSDGVTCIQDSQICDGILGHCPGGTDELACAEWACISGYTKCSDGLQCIAGNLSITAYPISRLHSQNHICVLLMFRL